MNEKVLLISEITSEFKIHVTSDSVVTDDRSRRERRIDSLTKNSMTMNIRFKKQAYAITLTSISQLTSFHEAFAVCLKRLFMNKSRLHRDSLSEKSRYWKQMKRHCFAREFQIKELIELKKRDTYQLMKKSDDKSRISFTWVFKYKYDTDEYLNRFKTRFCARDDLQVTEKDTYAIILAAKMFKIIMIIATAFDLEIFQYDAINAFINNNLDDEIYTKCIDEFDQSEFCWKLQRALYELKQISVLWYRELIIALKELEMSLVSKINCLSHDLFFRSRHISFIS